MFFAQGCDQFESLSGSFNSVNVNELHKCILIVSVPGCTEALDLDIRGSKLTCDSRRDTVQAAEWHPSSSARDVHQTILMSMFSLKNSTNLLGALVVMGLCR